MTEEIEEIPEIVNTKIQQLTDALTQAGISGVQIYPDLTLKLPKGLTPEQREKANKILVEVGIVPPPTIDELRKAEYDKRGATVDALTIALWEEKVEGKPDALDELQAIREQVKLDIPDKP